MNYVKRNAKQIISTVALATLAFGCTSYDVHQRVPASSAGMTDAVIAQASTSGPLGVKSARLIIDNDASFQSKLDLINSAKEGDEIRVAYYIYSDDESSSVFTAKLIEAARMKHVKVKLMVDLMTNYASFDLFRYMNWVTSGGIEVKFYGRPTEEILKDAMFLTQACTKGLEAKTDECDQEKWAKVRANFSNSGKPANMTADYFSSMYLAGLYAKNADLMKYSSIIGQQQDPNQLKTLATPKTEKDKLKMQELGKTAFQAKVNHSKSAYFKLSMALAKDGDKLNPLMNALTGMLPMVGQSAESQPYWDHLSDFLHQKVLIVGKQGASRYGIQLGGRNIENSYHMKPNPFTKKYIFMDTDMNVEVDQSGASVAAAYDNVWNFSPFVATLDEVYALIPNDFLKNPERFQQALGACAMQRPNTNDSERTAIGYCMQTLLVSPGMKDINTRFKEVEATMTKNAGEYTKNYKQTFTQSWKSNSPYDDKLDASEAQSMLLAYLENVPYSKSNMSKRLLGATNGQEGQSGKHIHEVWMAGMENTCMVSAATGVKKRVIFHSAYFFLPSNVIDGLGKMVDGTWDCHNVQVDFLTNSVDTTDLGPVNLFSMHQMLVFFQFYKTKQNGRSATFAQYEYLKPKTGANLSLHTKLTVVGDDMVIGSANADVRSYYMDANNGFVVRRAPKMISQYIAFFDSLLANKEKVSNETPKYMGYFTKEILAGVDDMFLKGGLAKYKMINPANRTDKATNKVSVTEEKAIYNEIRKLAIQAEDQTAIILNNGPDEASVMEDFNATFEIF